MDLSFLEQLLGETIEEEEVEGYRNVWVASVAWSDQLKESDYQLVGKARELANSLGAYVTGLVLGESASEAMAHELIAYGADHVYVVPGYPTDASLADFLAEKKPEMVLFNDGAGSRKFAPQLSQRLGASLVTHAVDLSLDVENRSLMAASPLYDGLAYQVVACHTPPQMATVQAGVFPTPYRDDWREGTVEMVDLPCKPQPPLNQVQVPAHDIPLERADIVVAGGRGMAQAGWQLVEELAAALSNKYPQRSIAVAGSRGALDSGWIGEDRMVDMSGRIIAPDLYIACGISGTFQHFGAMERSSCVVAINRNPGAAIFKHADYGIVGDVAEVIPALIEALNA